MINVYDLINLISTEDWRIRFEIYASIYEFKRGEVPYILMNLPVYKIMNPDNRVSPLHIYIPDGALPHFKWVAFQKDYKDFHLSRHEMPKYIICERTK